MSHSSEDFGDQDSLDLQDEIDVICDDFETEIKAGRTPRIEDMLEKIPFAGRARLLRELLAVEIFLARNKSENGNQVPLEQYYERFPGDHGILDALTREWKQNDTPSYMGSTRFHVEPTRKKAPPIPTQLGHFNLLSMAGKGGFGQVWKAYDTKLKRDVAIKVPNPSLSSQLHGDVFLQEAQVVAGLRHENIVTVYEIGEQEKDSPWFIVSEFIDGPNLKEWLKTHEISAIDAARLVLQVTKGLTHAHSRGVVHRDLKPANILMTEADKPLLTDFGLAKHESSEDMFAVEGRLVGTIQYMAPEQARGNHSAIDQRTDIYSLGVIIYELTVGQPMFQGNGKSILEQIEKAAPPRPRKLKPSIPEDLEQICLKCLAKDPADRYQTAEALATDLDHFLAEEPLDGITSPRHKIATKWIKRQRRFVAAVCVTVALCGGLGAVVWAWAAPTPFKRRVEFTTTPPGCEITVVKLDDATGDPDPSQIEHAWGRTPLKMSLAPGDYLVIAVQDDQHFHEVIRHVPDVSETVAFVGYQFWQSDKSGVIRYPMAIKIPDNDSNKIRAMALVPGEDRLLAVTSSSKSTPTPFKIPSFFVDTHETLADTSEQSLAAKPRLKYPWFSHAVIFAELTGRRLPTEIELIRLSKLDSDFRTQHPRKQLTLENKLISGVNSLPWEWTITKPPSSFKSQPWPFNAVRILKCGEPLNPSIPMQGPTSTYISAEIQYNPNVSVRCVRSIRPRRTPADFPTHGQSELQ